MSVMRASLLEQNLLAVGNRITAKTAHSSRKHILTLSLPVATHSRPTSHQAEAVNTAKAHQLNTAKAHQHATNPLSVSTHQHPKHHMSTSLLLQRCQLLCHGMHPRIHCIFVSSCQPGSKLRSELVGVPTHQLLAKGELDLSSTLGTCNTNSQYRTIQ